MQNDDIEDIYDVNDALNEFKYSTEDTLEELKYAIRDIQKDIKQLKKDINEINSDAWLWGCDRIESDTRDNIYALRVRLRKLEEKIEDLKCVSN